MAIKIVNADIIEWAKNYKGPQFHALFCDAPYELNFMGKSWDSSGIAFNPDTWRALAEHLLPGAFLFVFAGTLNDDLISVAMRQAGLRKFHKAALYWNFASGFPKASRIDTAIDRAAGMKRKIVGERIYADGHIQRSNAPRFNGTDYNNGKTYFEKSHRMETAPTTPLAKTWAGHRYGLQAIKPAVETILIFMKPYDGKSIDSIVKYGSGALNIDKARIPTNGETISAGTANSIRRGTFNEHDGYKRPWKKNDPERFASKCDEAIERANLLGRWPANLLLVHHSPDCNGTCSPECAIRELDEQAGERKSGGRKAGQSWIRKGEITGFGGKYAANCKGNVERDYVSDSGGASRFFFRADWNYEAAEKIENAAGVRYQAKASRRERDAGLDGLPLVKFAQGNQAIAEIKRGKDHKGSTGLNTVKTVRNNHPCVKPISLCRYLCQLLLPPAEYAPRRLLIPFSGSCSEAIGAMLAGWDEIFAIEKEKEYCDIGAARVKYWEKHQLPEKKAKKVRPGESAVLQETLFE